MGFTAETEAGGATCDIALTWLGIDILRLGFLSGGLLNPLKFDPNPDMFETFTSVSLLSLLEITLTSSKLFSEVEGIGWEGFVGDLDGDFWPVDFVGSSGELALLAREKEVEDNIVEFCFFDS